ncbi:MAG: rod shape-determining protein MreD [Acidimicrobiia bacterium]
MNPTTVRLPPLLVAAVLLHIAVLPQFRVFGVAADVLVLAGVAAGVAGGPERGALVGFACGLLADCFLQTPFGLTALVLTLVSWGVGAFQTRIVHVIWWIPMLTMAVGAAATVVGYAILGAVMGEDHLISTHLLVVAAVVGVLDGLVGPLAVRAMRWALDVDHRGAIVLGAR